MRAAPPDRCYWCDGSRPKAAGLCLTHAWLFGHSPQMLAEVRAEIVADRRLDWRGIAARWALVLAAVVIAAGVLRWLE